jgi:hypothetical protein
LRGRITTSLLRQKTAVDRQSVAGDYRRRHCERSEAISRPARTRPEIASSLRSSQ